MGKIKIVNSWELMVEKKDKYAIETMKRVWCELLFGKQLNKRKGNG